MPRFNRRRDRGRIIGLDTIEAPPQPVEPRHRNALDTDVRRDRLINPSLRRHFVAACVALAEVSVDPVAVRFAQPAVDEPGQQLPNVLMVSDRLIDLVHTELRKC